MSTTPAESEPEELSEEDAALRAFADRIERGRKSLPDSVRRPR